MFVPLNRDGAKGWIFDLVCPGNAMSVSHERLLLLKSAAVNRDLGFNDVCKEKHVNVAYNMHPQLFWVSPITGKMKNLPLAPWVR